ncbi:hypothetical protein yc1106_00958 [Curvularia clavata]|uniref:Cyclin-D1-binding protein 1-like N-terminal domain-containing protein n=1 Tax=Curvularia clavata TaxID=95742 RepID=A0A9Q8Z2I6_CURCL|nr:hypothetical protein yc1106_00958 [Curvularia clavata]
MSKPKDLSTLIEVTKTTQTLITHYQSSLTPSKNNALSTTTAAGASSTEIPNPLELLNSSTTLLKSHTTTLSLLLINPPLTPSAVVTKMGNVSEGPLSGMVAAASYVPGPGQRGDVGDIMRAEMRAQVKALLGSWSEVLSVVLRIAEKMKQGKKDQQSVTEAEKQEVLAATGVVWDACDGVGRLCSEGVVGLVVKKAQAFRAVLMDAIEELKEWGEDVDDDEDDDEAEGSDDENELFGTEKKLGKDDEALKALLEHSLKKLKMMGILYQALVKRRLKTYPASSILEPTASTSSNSRIQEIKEGGEKEETKQQTPSQKLNEVMRLLKDIPETVDDIAAAFYDLDADEAKETLDKCCQEAKAAVRLVEKSWSGEDDEFTVWSGKWVGALEEVAGETKGNGTEGDGIARGSTSRLRSSGGGAGAGGPGRRAGGRGRAGGGGRGAVAGRRGGSSGASSRGGSGDVAEGDAGGGAETGDGRDDLCSGLVRTRLIRNKIARSAGRATYSEHPPGSTWWERKP